jgi:hypothetical protein
MKILAISYEEDSFRLFSDIFSQESDFFDVTYANFFPEKIFFDAIFAENSDEKMSTISTPILLLKNSHNLEQDNIFVIKEQTAQNIRQTLRKIYETPKEKPQSNIVLSNYSSAKIHFKNQKIIFQFDNDENFLFKIYQTLKNYDVPNFILKKIGIVLCEILINEGKKKIISIFEFFEEKINLFLPEINNFFFSIQAFCDFCEKTKEGMKLSWYKTENQ